MSQKAIREFDGKRMLGEWLAANTDFEFGKVARLGLGEDIEAMETIYPWLKTEKLVAKPDQLIKRRGKAGLLCINKDWQAAKEWILTKRDKEQQVEVVSGLLDTFIVEPFVPHKDSDEYYFCVHSVRTGDEILFYHQGGVDVGDVDAKATKWLVGIDEKPTAADMCKHLLMNVPKERHARLSLFLEKLFVFYVDYHFSYLEINPLVMLDDGKSIIALDMAAKLDESANFEVGKLWGNVDFPSPFGRPPRPEEAYIKALDGKTGASLKLTILNPEGRIWTMVAGGGASVVYADTISDKGFGKELANYGEYSGAPSTTHTYEYAKTLMQAMTKTKHPQGKIFLIGGGIANFTDVAATFKGIVKALTEFADRLREYKVTIYVRRGGPNYQEGLKIMRLQGEKLRLPIHVYGPESHMTEIVSIALGLKEPEGSSKHQRTPSRAAVAVAVKSEAIAEEPAEKKIHQYDEPVPVESEKEQTFHPETKSIIFGLQLGACQNMLDFDYLCGRKTPSVCAMVYPFMANHYQKFYWNTDEILIPIYQKLEEALKKFPEVDTAVNFASFRSAHEATMDLLDYPQIKTIAIIAEGVPERRAKQIIKKAAINKTMIIGPATVGGIKPGCFRIGNTGGMLDNIISSKLYRPGSVAYVTRSGGMSNELNNVLARTTDGVYEGVAIGGDMYPGTSFMDHIVRYNENPHVKMLVVLGEVGGVEEYEICKAIENGTIKKPLVAWCIGTCAKMFPYEVQFGHAGACATGNETTADAKNKALIKAGAFVPESFEELPLVIKEQYDKLVKSGVIVPAVEIPAPIVPMDYDWARKLGMVRKPANFISTISDERGEELIYSGMTISKVFEKNLGLGGTLGLLWFRKQLPDWCNRFIEMCLIMVADHGPAVSGAHNTIVASRAGKDLVSSLCSGLLTIGPRFGGALDGAAESFVWATDNKMTPQEFVNHMRKSNQLIQGIGHKVKSLDNPDKRVELIKDYVMKHFPAHDLFDYALAVQEVTTKKKANLILNVDGAIAVAFCDLLKASGAFNKEEIDEYIGFGALNGIFVLGRSMGFIGHYIDQKRLKQGLYRHDTKDITYIVGQSM